MTKLEAAAIIFSIFAVISAIFISPLKIALIISVECIIVSWLCILLQGKKDE